MWVTPDGVQHTLALPDPADVLTPDALASFVRLATTTDHDTLALWLDDRLIDLHDAGFEADEDGLFFERVPDAGILDGDLGTLDDLAEALSAIDPRWQVDLLFALQDILDEIREQA